MSFTYQVRKVHWASFVILLYFTTAGIHCQQLLSYHELTAFSFKWRPFAILHFKKLEILTDGPVRKSNASPSQISYRSVKPLRRYGRFSIFKMAAVRRLGFVLRVFGPPTESICWSLSLCKIWLKSLQ